ncbi:hypothetical protein [Embleya sp. MST-111070]|uniref:hypothetical protein n=1 Tax=Embleya sp. MST-111070 TaxID=3398231 RepID=UPI003F73873E
MTPRRMATALSLTVTSALIVALAGVPAPSAPVAPDRPAAAGRADHHSAGGARFEDARGARVP